jgi:hypothetical protein
MFLNFTHFKETLACIILHFSYNLFATRGKIMNAKSCKLFKQMTIPLEMKLSFDKKDSTRTKPVIVETAQTFAWGMVITQIQVQFNRNNTRVTSTKDGLKEFSSIKINTAIRAGGYRFGVTFEDDIT